MWTPWGKSQEETEFPGGIRFVSTASHGGFKVPAHLLDRVPLEVREGTFGKLGVEGWFEEDCDASLVPVWFPESFTAEQVARAAEFRAVLVARGLATG